MLKISKIFILVACPIIIVDQILSIMMYTTPMWWTVIAGPVMTALLGIGLIIFAGKTGGFRNNG